MREELAMAGDGGHTAALRVIYIRGQAMAPSWARRSEAYMQDADI